MQIKTILFLFILHMAIGDLSATNRKVISGFVLDDKTGEVLIGAVIYDLNSKTGTTTNSQGRYTLWISAECDSLVLEASYMGYATQTKNFTCNKISIDWRLEQSQFSLTEVEISASVRKPHNPTLSSFSVNKAELEALPGFAGEKDIIKYIQLSPGVRNTGDSNSNLFVRGGSADQNLFLLDDMPLYHVNHLGNITSTFNSDIIKSAHLYLGAFPVEYGGRLSSVVDVRTKDGDLYNHHQSFTLGVLTSKILLEGPLIKGKASYLASFRVNTLPLLKLFGFMGVDFSMYDANLKLNYILSAKSRLYFSLYTGDDAMKHATNGTNDNFTTDISTSWGNRAVSLRYNHFFTSQLQLNLIAGHSKYHYKEESNINFFNDDREVQDVFKSSFTSSIADNFIIARSNYSLSNRVRLKAGYSYFNHIYKPGDSKIKQSGINLSNMNLDLSYPHSNSLDHSFFADLTFDELWGFGLYAGLRNHILITEEKTFHDLQPRIILSRKITNEIAMKLSYAQIWQPFHLLSNNSAGVPADYRIPSMDMAPPAKSNQSSFALSYIPEASDYEFSAEAYYKTMTNLTDLKAGVSFTIDYSDWEKILATNGIGTAKGIELLIRKVKGSSTGWIGSSLSNSTRQFPDLNDGKPYPYKYDRLLDLGVLFQQQITKKITASATWVFGTGMPYNIPQSFYEDIEGNHVLIYGVLNQFRQKSYHRLDVGLNYKKQNHKSISIWDFSIINVYNRRNPYLYRTTSSSSGVRLWEFSLFPILPSISYSVKF